MRATHYLPPLLLASITSIKILVLPLLLLLWFHHHLYSFSFPFSSSPPFLLWHGRSLPWRLSLFSSSLPFHFLPLSLFLTLSSSLSLIIFYSPCLASWYDNKIKHVGIYSIPHQFWWEKSTLIGTGPGSNFPQLRKAGSGLGSSMILSYPEPIYYVYL